MSGKAGSRRPWPRQGAGRSSKWSAGDGFVWLISTIDSVGVLRGTEVDLAVGFGAAVHPTLR